MTKSSDFITTLRTLGKRSRITRSEFRKDYLHDRYVLIAPRRGKRHHPTTEIHQHTGVRCVFCPSGLGKGEILKTYGAKKWRIAAVKNIFPAVTPQNTKAYGRQEVIIETPDHNVELQELSDAQVAQLFAVYADRMRTMKRDGNIQYIIVFKNFGGASGATLSHAHSQMIGMEFVPPHLKDKTEREHRYQAQYGRCPYCDIIKEEMRGPRRIYADKHVVAFAPWASFHSYEAVIMPRRHVDNVNEMNSAERRATAVVLKKILTAVLKLNVPYNYYFHERVRDSDQHMYTKITPRGALWAAVEIGTGVVINPVPPEDAAKFYRLNLKSK